MTILQMLTEMINTKEFLVLIAFAILVYAVEMCTACFPIRGWFVGKLCATVPANIECGERCGQGLRLPQIVIRKSYTLRSVDQVVKVVFKGNAGPGVFSKMQRILMTLERVLSLEAIGAVFA